MLCTVGCGGGGGSTSPGPGLPGVPTPTPTVAPAQPVDITPLSGEVYYVVNQLSGFQTDLNNNSVTAGDHIIQQTRSFTNLSQRWVFTKLTSGGWRINNTLNSLCFDTAIASAVAWVVQNPCAGTATQEWTLAAAPSGYTQLRIRAQDC